MQALIGFLHVLGDRLAVLRDGKKQAHQLVDEPPRVRSRWEFVAVAGPLRLQMVKKNVGAGCHGIVYSDQTEPIKRIDR